MRIHNLTQKYKYFNIDNKYFHEIKFKTHSLNSLFMKVNYKDAENEIQTRIASARVFIPDSLLSIFIKRISSQMR